MTGEQFTMAADSQSLPIEHEIVLVNGVPTLVSSATPSEEGSDITVVVIPGNPGCIRFYDVFISTLFEAGKRKFPVYGVSHAGHAQLHEASGVCQWRVRSQWDQDFPNSFSLEDQIEHKMCFLDCHIPQKSKVILVGHSLGAYMSLEILRTYRDRAKIIKTVLLFPAIENVGSSPNGRLWKFICFYLHYPVLVATVLASLLPSFVRKWSIGWWMYFNGVREHHSTLEAVQTLLTYTSMDNMLQMGRELTTTINELDQTCVEENLHKLVFCYGRRDPWVPPSRHQELARKFPGARIEYAGEGVRHAFILDSSEEMARRVWKWLEEDFV